MGVVPTPSGRRLSVGNGLDFSGDLKLRVKSNFRKVWRQYHATIDPKLFALTRIQQKVGHIFDYSTKEKRLVHAFKTETIASASLASTDGHFNVRLKIQSKKQNDMFLVKRFLAPSPQKPRCGCPSFVPT